MAVRKEEGHEAIEKIKEVGNSKEDKKRMRIRVCECTVIPPFPKDRVAVSTAKSGLIVIDPLLYARDLLYVANGIDEVSPNEPFRLFIRNLAANERSLPKHTAITTGAKSTLSQTEVPADADRELEKYLTIFGEVQKGSATINKMAALPMKTEKEKWKQFH